MEHSKHIIRAAILLLLGAITFVVGRHFAIPDTFGEVGHYRYASIAEIAAAAPVHGGAMTCAECHEDEVEFVFEEEHRSVPCEVCHAPLATHAESGEQIAEMAVLRSYRLCAYCHQRLRARPPSFPQVILSDHVQDKGGVLVEDVCLECHDAHDPLE